jgi:hypothetical protein
MRLSKLRHRNDDDGQGGLTRTGERWAGEWNRGEIVPESRKWEYGLFCATSTQGPSFVSNVTVCTNAPEPPHRSGRHRSAKHNIVPLTVPLPLGGDFVFGAPIALLGTLVEML